MTRLETVLQVLALVTPRLTPLPTNGARTCKMTVSSLVIQITISSLLYHKKNFISTVGNAIVINIIVTRQ
jgi:hypothetical protein